MMMLKASGTILSCLRQFQGKSSRGKISTLESFCKEMTPPDILNILNATEANIISFLLL